MTRLTGPLRSSSRLRTQFLLTAARRLLSPAAFETLSWPEQTDPSSKRQSHVGISRQTQNLQCSALSSHSKLQQLVSSTAQIGEQLLTVTFRSQLSSLRLTAWRSPNQTMQRLRRHRRLLGGSRPARPSRDELAHQWTSVESCWPHKRSRGIAAAHADGTLRRHTLPVASARADRRHVSPLHPLVRTLSPLPTRTRRWPAIQHLRLPSTSSTASLHKQLWTGPYARPRYCSWLPPPMLSRLALCRRRCIAAAIVLYTSCSSKPQPPTARGLRRCNFKSMSMSPKHQRPGETRRFNVEVGSPPRGK